MIVFERDPGGVTADAHDACDTLVRPGNGSFVVACKDALPQFGKDDVDVIRFASLRFDHALDEDDRSAVTRALASRDTSIAFWETAAGRSYAIARGTQELGDALAREIGASVDDPPLAVLRVRPVFAARLPALAHALAGSGRPAAVFAAHVASGEIVVEMAPNARALELLLALVDATLAATPGRTIVPVLPLGDALLADFASLRLHDAEIDVSRVLDIYVENFASAARP